MNEILFAVSVLSTFSLVVLFYRLFGKAGMFAWTAFGIVFANIEVAKCINLFGLETTLGNVMFGSTFLATDILSENHGKAAAKKAVYIGLAAVCAFIAMLQLSLAFVPSANDIASKALKEAFALTPRICIASVALYFVANISDVHLYHFIKERLPGHLWLRNNVATMTCQIAQAFFFCFAAFGGVFPLRMILEISLTTALVECIVAACDTPFLYVARQFVQSCANVRKTDGEDADALVARVPTSQRDEPGA